MEGRYNRIKESQDAQVNQADALTQIANALTALAMKYAADYLPKPPPDEPPVASSEATTKEDDDGEGS